jgi:hypothetical protein
MARHLIKYVILAVSFFVFAVSSSAEDGAKALFYGETSKESVDVKKTESGAAMFSGTVINNESIPTKPDVVTSDTKRTTIVAQHKTKKISKKIATGLSYFIEVIKPEGKVDRVTAEKRVFKSGERIRFVFKSNKEGYLYLLAIGSSGRGAILFPDNRINSGNNLVAANKEYRVPFGEKSFVMDTTPGNEKVLVFFSQTGINDINNYFLPNKKLEAQDTRTIYAFADTKGSKDILFEEDAVSGGIEPASYIVNKDNNPKSVIVKEILVRHR